MSDQQLQKKNQQQIIRTPAFVNYKQVDDHIGKMKIADYEIKDQQYTMYFESQEEMDEADRILDSDKALIQYYEKNAPEKLAGLRSKNFFNFPGKKAEKKKLRKAFFSQEQTLIDDYRKTHDVADKTDEQVA